jgi:Fe2+ transport system protein B
MKPICERVQQNLWDGVSLSTEARDHVSRCPTCRELQEQLSDWREHSRQTVVSTPSALKMQVLQSCMNQLKEEPHTWKERVLRFGLSGRFGITALVAAVHLVLLTAIGMGGLWGVGEVPGILAGGLGVLLVQNLLLMMLSPLLVPRVRRRVRVIS